jgi:triphosphoribosyl-dephospho-CoA synthetase
MASLASFEELFVSPKPGLVGPLGRGSHDDMDWTTFLLSAAALAPHWREQAAVGAEHGYYKPLNEMMAPLRERGIEMERAMFAATGGVNTHKGLVFALSLLVGASGYCAAAGKFSPTEICRTASAVASPAVIAEFEKLNSMGAAYPGASHGEKIFAAHGIGGIRREAMEGFPRVLSALGAMRAERARGACLNDAALDALLLLMTQAEDTNVIHRAGVGFWRGEYRERVISARDKFNPASPGDYAPLSELDDFLSRHRASPGGAADLLACTLFLYRSKITDNSL